MKVQRCEGYSQQAIDLLVLECRTLDAGQR
jgi:hypothetical protein